LHGAGEYCKKVKETGRLVWAALGGHSFGGEGFERGSGQLLGGQLGGESGRRAVVNTTTSTMLVSTATSTTADSRPRAIHETISALAAAAAGEGPSAAWAKAGLARQLATTSSKMRVKERREGAATGGKYLASMA
jgi:hypothetical protein